MIVRVRVFGHLRNYCKLKTSKEFEVDLPYDATVEKLLESLSIPEGEEMIVLVNEMHVQLKETKLNENNAVSIYPFVGGG